MRSFGPRDKSAGRYAGSGISSGRAPRADKPIAWLHGEIKTPPMSREVRVEVGTLLRRLQRGEAPTMPESRPLPVIGARCHELRVGDTRHKIEWRVIYYTGKLAIAILDVFKHDTRTTPEAVIASCRRRLAQYQELERSW